MEVPFVSFRPVEQELNDELRSAFDRVYLYRSREWLGCVDACAEGSWNWTGG